MSDLRKFYLDWLFVETCAIICGSEQCCKHCLTLTTTWGEHAMAYLELIEPVHLRQLLSCDPEAGLLIWQPRPIEAFSNVKSWRVWNARFSGKRACAASNGKGYLRGMIKNHKYFAHRVVWAMTHGKWPSDELDHVNGDKTDNRLANLRVVDRTTNNRNSARRKDNTTGATGVFKVRSTGRFMAYIRVDRRVRHLGFFGTFDEALTRRKAAEVEFGFHENHGRG